MRAWITLLLVVGSFALCAIIWIASGGRAFVLVLPLLFAPLLWRRRRS